MFDEGGAGGQVRVAGRLAQGEHRGHAGVRTVEDLGPFGAGAGAEPLGDEGAQFVPAGQVAPVGGRVRDAEEFGELGVEPLLQRPDRHVRAVGGLVRAVEGAPAVQEVGAAPVLPATGLQHALDHHGEVCGAVDDRRVDDLSAAAGRPGAVEGGEDADDEVERAARVVAEQVGGDGGRFVRLADHGERAGDGDVGDVVPGPFRERAVLAPAGHPPVDELRIAGEAGVRAHAEAFGDPGPVPLDQHVGALDEVQDGVRAGRVLEVDEDGALVAVGEVACRIDAETGPARPVDPHHVGAEIGQEHRGERAGPDARQLDHTHPGQRAVWPVRAVPCRCHRAPSGMTQLM